MRPLVLLALCASCAQASHPHLGPTSWEAPASLQAIVRIQVDEGDYTARGWATPVRPGYLLTVAHMAGQAAVFQALDGREGRLSLEWQDKRLAQFAGDTTGLQLVPIAASLPGMQDPVWWRFYVEPGDEPSIARGRVLGIDSDGDLQIDGMGAEGSSGSAVLNSKGELVAVMNAGWNPAGGPMRGGKHTLDEVLDNLFRKTAFRPVVAAVPVSGRIPGPQR